MSEKIVIEIDGRICEADPGEMIIAVADRAGIVIPRFCYHPKLSIAANCRMCLVEIEQNGRPFPKPAPACATPVGSGMKVLTRSPKALDAQRGTMEFLLINHPLDCPICDQGGECELQDVSVGYGGDVSRFAERKRVVADEDFGPLIATEMTRCIHCTRCVRFSAEIAGVRELGATGRGEEMRIGTFVSHTIAHELSGNIIDLCPVGALTSKPYRFKARAWELVNCFAIGPHDGLGSNLVLNVRRGQILRVNPRANDAINEIWLSDRDRFSYEGLTNPARLTQPLVKREGVWCVSEWSEVLHFVAGRFKKFLGEALGCLVAPNATLEEQYLAQKLFRGLGSGNIDSRLRQQDFRADAIDPLLPWLGLPIAALENQRVILIVGSDIRQEQPLIAHRLRQAARCGATVFSINPYRVSLNYENRQIVVSPQKFPQTLAALAKLLGVSDRGVMADLIAQAQPDETHEAIARALSQANGEASILLGGLIEASPNFSLIKSMVEAIAQSAGVQFGYLARAANTFGAYLAGAVPHRAPGARPLDCPGLDAMAMLLDPRQMYLLWGFDPDFDLIDPSIARTALARAEFVVAVSAFRTPGLESVADVLLPMASFGETAGTFVNISGDWQSFQGAVAPPGEARPGWKILRVLGNLLELDGFDYNNVVEIRVELESHCVERIPDNRSRGQLDYESFLVTQSDLLMRIGNVPIYAMDMLVRHAPSLQRTPLVESIAVHLHPDDAARLGFGSGDQVRIIQGTSCIESRLVLDDFVALGCARIPSAVPGSEVLGAAIGPMVLAKI